MRCTSKIKKLIFEIEYLIASECCGRGFYRYPINIKINDEYQLFHDYNLNHYEETLSFMKKSDIENMHYRFGSNWLFIGSAIIEVLQFLEERYNISFSELESKRKLK